MTTRMRRLAVLAAALSLATAVVAQDDVRLRPLAAVYVDTKGAGLARPEGVGCGGGSLVVADTGNGRLVRYDVRDRLIDGRIELEVPELPYPTRTVLAPDGDILVLDGKLRRIARVGSDGAFGGWIDVPDGVRESVPRSLRVGANGRILVLDVANGRVVVLGTNGRVVREIGFGAEHRFVSDLTVDRNGRVFLIDSVAGRVLTAGPDDEAARPLGEPLESHGVKFPVALEVDPSGRLLVVADQNGSDLVVLDTEGRFVTRQSGFGWKEGYLRYPTAVCLDDGGRLFVADRENDRVQMLELVR